MSFIEKIKIKKNICFILAHHDDETLFYGGLLNNLKETNNNIYLFIITDFKNENKEYNNLRKYENFLNILNEFKIKNYECLNFKNNLISNKKLDSYIIENSINKKKYINYRNKIKEIMILTNDLINLIKTDINSLNKKNNLKEEYEKIKIMKKDLLLIESKINKKIKKISNEKKEYIQGYKIEENSLNTIYISDIKKKLIELDNKINFDIIFTHNEYGEYGNLQHKLVNYVIKKLKINEWENKDIYTTTNNISDIYIKINKKNKQDLLKIYDFKDDLEKKHSWFLNCINNYSFWSDNEYEYYNEMII